MISRHAAVFPPPMAFQRPLGRRAATLNVRAVQGTVSVWGVLPGFAIERDVLRVIGEVPEVRKVVPDFRVSLERVRAGEVH